MRIVQDRRPTKLFSGSGIGKLVKEFQAVNGDHKVSDLALDLPYLETTQCLAVLNDKEEAVGILVKREIEQELVKLYWRDIHQNDKLVSLVYPSKAFEIHTNALVVAEELRAELSDEKVRYYMVYQAESGIKKFYGIFSSLHLFRHLSEISQKDMQLAASLATKVTPDFLNEYTEHATIHGTSNSARGVGGDYYSIRYIGLDKILLSLCDVSGKGVSASLLATLIAGMVQVFDFANGKLGDFLDHLNGFLIETFEREKFVTGVFMEIDLPTGTLTMYDYGHSHIFLYRDNHFHRLKTDDEHPPLGIQEDGTIHPNHFQLEPGDTVVLLTDGIHEQENDSEEEYGLTRVADWIHQAKMMEQLAHVGKFIIDDVATFRQNQPQMDDQTILVFNYKHPKNEEVK